VNTELPRVEIRVPTWNVKTERSVQLAKQRLEMVLIDEGIQID
jgi:hypothetical protein